MLSRALDQIFLAASVLPEHLTTARRAYGDQPQAREALDRLEAALADARAALARGRYSSERRQAGG
jgi:hypothetical protein